MNNPQNRIFTNPGNIQIGLFLWVLNFSVLHNAGVNGLRVAQSRWMTCYARPCFWHWTFVLTFLAPNQQNITARFAQCQLLIFETNQNRLLWNQKLTWKYSHPEVTDKMKLLPFLASSKTNHWNHHPNKQYTKPNIRESLKYSNRVLFLGFELLGFA